MLMLKASEVELDYYSSLLGDGLSFHEGLEQRLLHNACVR